MEITATCPRCAASLAAFECNTPEPIACRTCGNEVWVHVFPAMFRAHTTPVVASPIVQEGQSSCFFHPQKASVCLCDMCGRFLCALCDMPLQGKHLCPNCLQIGKTKGTIGNLQTSTQRHDLVVLAVALVPILIFWVTIITAPLGLILSIYYWRRSRGVLGYPRVRIAIAMVICILQIIGWIIAGIFIFDD